MAVVVRICRGADGGKRERPLRLEDQHEQRLISRRVVWYLKLFVAGVETNVPQCGASKLSFSEKLSYIRD